MTFSLLFHRASHGRPKRAIVCPAIALIMLYATFTTSCAAVNPTPSSKQVPILARDAGSAPRVKTERGVVLQSTEQVAQCPIDGLMRLRRQAEQRTKQDLCIVVYALGQRPTAGYQVRITEITCDQDVLTIHVTTAPPPPDRLVAQVLTYPYDAVAIPCPPCDQVRWVVQ